MNVFRKMLEFFDGGKRWRRGSRGDSVMACLLGGAAFVTHGNTTYDSMESAVAGRKLAAIIREQYPDRFEGVNYPADVVMTFNDRVAQDYSEVERILEKAAVKEEEGW